MTPAEPRVLFVGAVQEGRRCLEALLAHGERFAGFVTLDPALAASTSGWVPFDDLAADHGVPLITVRDLNTPENVARVADLRPDLILVIGWTRLLGPALLRLPPLGAIGFHASLLPRYRGRAPVNWALINGERETGNTMFFLDEGVDTGDVIAQRRIPILDADDCATVYEKVSDAATSMLVEHLPVLKAGSAPRIAQDERLATVMPRRRPEEGVIDWTRDARSLFNWVRALTHPYPGAFATLEGRRLFVWKASEVATASGVWETDRPKAGLLIAGPGDSVHVGTGEGLLRLDRVQWTGEAEQPGSALRPLTGAVLGEE
ncbi:methionyl-tRNA formyltransferase [Pseudonocardia sp. H11422]|uniref:methionyl-tRNA formyltransferase n=1 Tax=Pseudonocardia sp. H11422 TaxID=2835866 RepID=UPI001BDC7F9B|nr:methionyl-tRNA formyltransferase [Pseudonocardia sp. H11422]